MDMIRSKGKLTRLLILRELVIEEPKDQKSIAGSLEITPQAVSEYLKKMAREGLVDLSFKPPRPTVKGVDVLHRDLLQLKGFIDRSIDSMYIVRSTDAIAASEIRKGERVRLFIDNGLLYCSQGAGGSSSGTAESDGDIGDTIVVSDLSGLVEMPHANISFVEIRSVREGGGSVRIDDDIMDRIRSKGSTGEFSRTAVLDQEAASIFIRSRLNYDMEFPSSSTVKDTLERGVSMICFGTLHSISAMMSAHELSTDSIKKRWMKLDDVIR
ncbi:MAG: ArsR family transcriptional regulator [Thermoplasmatota archaeon]